MVPDPSSRPAHEEPTLPPAGQPLTEPEAVAADASAGLPEQFGRYVILKKLGQGGMGAVYQARDTSLDRVVALKVPFLRDPDTAGVRARFLQEARSAAVLHHPNICPIHDLGEIDGVPYLTMAFINGEPLTRKVAPDKPPAVSEAVRLVRQMALALQYAHDHGVIHRDLKPGNVLIDDRGEPVVMDFGLARRESPAAEQLTQEGQLMGTPAYMPPEQVNVELTSIGPASDVYGLGVVLYELLTGGVPFEGDFLSLLSRVTLEPPLPPSRRRPGLDPRLDAVCLKALEKQPSRRWPSMTAFADALSPWCPVPSFAQAPPLVPRDSSTPTLVLRVEGTAFAYRPPPGQDVISVGRQRRNPGDPPDHGNDFVLRVAGNDQLSTRISRRHFEIQRRADGYVVIDHSKAGLVLNGQPVPKLQPTPIRSGDKLLVAGVIGLEVLVQPATTGLASALVEVPPLAPSPGQVVAEASMGDMVTVE